MSYSRKHAGETGSMDGAPLAGRFPGTYSNRPDASNDLSLASLEAMMVELARANASHEAYQAQRMAKAGAGQPAQPPARADLWSTRVIAQADQARRCERHLHVSSKPCLGPGDRLVTRLVPRISQAATESNNHAWLCEVHMREMAHSWEWVPVRGRVTIADGLQWQTASRGRR